MLAVSNEPSNGEMKIEKDSFEQDSVNAQNDIMHSFLMRPFQHFQFLPRFNSYSRPSFLDICCEVGNELILPALDGGLKNSF